MPHAEFGPNYHRNDAPHFIFYFILEKTLPKFCFTFNPLFVFSLIFNYRFGNSNENINSKQIVLSHHKKDFEILFLCNFKSHKQFLWVYMLAEMQDDQDFWWWLRIYSRLILARDLMKMDKVYQIFDFVTFFSSDCLIVESSGTVRSLSASDWVSSVSSTFFGLRFFRIWMNSVRLDS